MDMETSIEAEAGFVASTEDVLLKREAGVEAVILLASQKTSLWSTAKSKSGKLI